MIIAKMALIVFLSFVKKNHFSGKAKVERVRFLFTLEE